MLAYSEYYFPMMEAMLDKHGLPLELKYLSIVESGLNPKARSVSGAVGLWQFMYLTGKQYNLSVSLVYGRTTRSIQINRICMYLF